MKSIAAGLLSLLLTATTVGQDRSRQAEHPEREGGIPRELIVPDDNRVDQPGTEEGLPSLRVEPNDRRVAPYVLPPEHSPWKLGVYAYYTDTGVVVTRVVPGSPAQQVGLERGDRIVSVNGFQVGWIMDRLYPLDAELQRQAGRNGQVLLLVQNVRNSQLLNLDVRLDRRGRQFRDPARTRSSSDAGSVAPENLPDDATDE